MRPPFPENSRALHMVAMPALSAEALIWVTLAITKRVRAEVQGLGLALERDYCWTNFVGSVNFERIDDEPEVAGRSLNISGFTKRCRIGGMGQHRQPSECGNHRNQKLDPFSGHISRLKRQSGDIAPGARKPGCSQKPLPNGSTAAANTMGIVDVARLLQLEWRFRQ